MEPNLNVKPPRRPWTGRELGLLIAVMVLAVALLLERNARQAGDREVAHQSSKEIGLLVKEVDSHGASNAEWKIESQKKLDRLESRVIDLEHLNNKRAGN